MATLILGTQTVNRNGEEFEFIKTKQGGKNSRENWKIKLEPEDLEGCRYARFIGPKCEQFTVSAVNNKLGVFFNGNQISGDDEKFFEWLERECLVQVNTGGGKTKKATQKFELQVRTVIAALGVSREEAIVKVHEINASEKAEKDNQPELV